MNKLNLSMLPQHKRDIALPSIITITSYYRLMLLIIDKVNIVKGTVKEVKMLRRFAICLRIK